MTTILGIDPGLSGAIAALRDEKPIFFITFSPGFSFSDFQMTLKLAESVNHIYLEKAQCMPKNGARGMFNYGLGFGKILGWIESLGIPHTLVTPQAWTKVMHQGCTGKDSKAKSLQAVQRLFPSVELRSTARCKKPHLGIVDALLIAEYGRRQFK